MDHSEGGVPATAARMRTLLITLICLLPFSQQICNTVDHQVCDELCKSDSFWYGHCSAWDGVDFSCTCFEYKPPLSGEKCKEKQEHCKEKCRSQGAEGGFCYPQIDRNGTARTSCECFKEIPQLRRKRASEGLIRRRLRL